MKLLKLLFFQSWAEADSTTIDETWKSQKSFELTDQIFQPKTGQILNGQSSVIWSAWLQLKNNEIVRTNVWSSLYSSIESFKSYPTNCVTSNAEFQTVCFAWSGDVGSFSKFKKIIW